MRKRVLVVLAAFALCAGAASARAAQPVKAPLVLTKYVTALEHGDYAAAYALLTRSEQHYYRNSANFASVFMADDFKIAEFRVEGARSSSAGQVVFVRETVAYLDHARDKQIVARVLTPIGVLKENGVARIKDPGHPWKARGLNVAAEQDQLRVTVKKVAFYPHRVQLVITFANLGENSITLLPYGRTVLRDDLGNVYSIIAVKDWRLTDRELFLGLRLAPSAEYTGAINFELPSGAAPPASFSLTVAPALRDGADAPFNVDVGPIALS